VLITSRDALTGLVARDGARRLDLDLLPHEDAIALLRTLIGARVDADPDAAAVLATRCARLPLALRVAAELAAARPASPLADLADELADQQERLALLDAGGDPRAAVRAVFSWSYRNLDTPTAAAFRLVGTDPGPDLDPYAAAALTGTTVQQARRVLRELTRAHLTQPSGPGRYGMHDLLRAYARDLAAAHDSEDQQRAALTRLFDHYLYTAAKADGELFPAEQVARPAVPPPTTDVQPLPDPAAARGWLDAQLASLVRAVAYAAAHGWPSHATRLASHLFSYLDTGGHYTEASAIHTSACCAACLAGDHAAEANALTDLGAADLRQGRHQQAVELFRQAVSLSREAGNRQAQARALGNLALVENQQGHLGQASVHLEQSLAIRREIGDRSGEARTLTGIGQNDQLRGRYQRAAGHFRGALALAREIGDLTSEAYVLESLSTLELRLGRTDQASDLLHRALALYGKTGDRIGIAYVLVGLGKVAFQQDRFPEAADFTQRGLAFCREVGDRNGEAEALNCLAEILLATGDPELARTRHAAALSLACDAGYCYEQARAHSGLGCCYHAMADLARSREHWQQALAIYSQLGAPEAGQIRARLGAGTDQDYCPA
jgi:tetratricopeptide (TPR) repeat protein